MYPNTVQDILLRYLKLFIKACGFTLIPQCDFRVSIFWWHFAHEGILLIYIWNAVIWAIFSVNYVDSTHTACVRSNQLRFWIRSTTGLFTRVLPQVQTAELGFLRRVQGVSLHYNVCICEIRRALNDQLLLRIERSQPRSFGNMTRMSQERLARREFEGNTSTDWIPRVPNQPSSKFKNTANNL